MKKIILASASPRRRELLSSVDVKFEVEASNVSEDISEVEHAVDIPLYLARKKAYDIAQSHPDDIVIGCDTIVIVDDAVLTKPKDSDDAFRMLRLMSGRKHCVYTGCCIVCADTERSFCEKTEVEFFELSDDEINAYIATGECMDKAGAYGIQSKGKTLVRCICGDYYNVVGLPVARLKRELDLLIGQL